MNLKAQKIINETPNCGISLNSSKTGYVINNC